MRKQSPGQNASHRKRANTAIGIERRTNVLDRNFLLASLRGSPQASPGAVADVKHNHMLLLLQNSEYHAVDVRLVAVQQMPELGPLGRHRATSWPFLEAEDGILEPRVPFPGRSRILGVNVVVQAGKVALGAGGEINEVCHAWLRSSRRTPSPA